VTEGIFLLPNKEKFDDGGGDDYDDDEDDDDGDDDDCYSQPVSVYCNNVCVRVCWCVLIIVFCMVCILIIIIIMIIIIIIICDARVKNLSPFTKNMYCCGSQI